MILIRVYNMKTSGIKSNFSYKLMKLIHNNPIVEYIFDPYLILNEAGIKEGQTALEVGCGSGFFTIPAAQLVSSKGKIIALDINEIAIKDVKQKIKQLNLQNIIPLQQDAMNTTLTSDSIDLAFFFGVPRLFRMKEVFQKVFREMNRIIKPRGLISIKSKNSSLISKIESFNFKLIKRTNTIMTFQKQV